MYPSFIPTNPSYEQFIRTQQIIYVQQRAMTDAELYFAYFSLYILFPLLYNMLVSGNKSAVMVLWRYITSGVFDTVSYIKEVATNLFYGSLRMLGQYTFSTYTVVKDGREVFTSSSMYYYYKSDVKTVYRIDRAKYDVCKWIDRQCDLFLKIHGEDPVINDTENDIYDFILHKVDNQPYVRIHRGNFTGRTHTLITEHYRPCSKSYQFAPQAELTVWYPSCSVEPPMESNGGAEEGGNAVNDGDKEHTVYECYPPKVYKLNLKYPHHFLLEKNELLDVKFLKWKLYNEFGAASIAKRLDSLFYNYKVVMFYNDCMKENIEKTKAEIAIANAAEEAEAEAASSDKPLVAYTLSDKQSVIVGHTYVVKVDSLLRCPVFESNEKNVFDIDGVLTSYYTCSDTENDSDDERDDQDDSSVEGEGESDSCVEGESEGESEGEGEGEGEQQVTTEYDETEFEVIQESST